MLAYQVDHLLHPLVRPVAGLEVQVSRPVVGEVLAKRAGRARRFRGEVVVDGGHRGVKGVSADDLVDVGGLDEAWGNQGVDPFND